MNKLFGIHFSWALILLNICPSANRPGFTYEHLLPGDTSSHVIDSLEEDKKYIISIYAVYPQGPSEPVSVVGKTCKFSGFDQNTTILLIYLNIVSTFSHKMKLHKISKREANAMM